MKSSDLILSVWRKGRREHNPTEILLLNQAEVLKQIQVYLDEASEFKVDHREALRNISEAMTHIKKEV